MSEGERKQRSVVDWIVLALGTGLFLGCVPLRTATIATALGIPLAYGLHSAAMAVGVGWGGYFGVLVVLWIIGIPICARSAKLLGLEDPTEITYDEIVTLPLVYMWIPTFEDWRYIVAGFALHRTFDIAKPLGIRKLERIGGGLGIMLDDIVAAAVALVVMQVLLFYQILE